jgi:poly(3-hydroxybutyrate) depolymerase
MLYEWYNNHREWMKPLSSFYHWGNLCWDHPASVFAYSPYSKQVAAACDLFYRLTREYKKPSFNLTHTLIDGKEVPIEEEQILTLPFCHLLHFKKPSLEQSQPCVILFAPLSGHYATLLRDTVRSLLPEHDVYITDWVDAKMVPMSQGSFDLADYVHYVQMFIRELQKKHTLVHAISVCQPTVPVLAAVSLMATKGEPLPKTMVMMGGPIDSRKSPTKVNNLATEKPLDWFEENVIYRVPKQHPGFGRRVYPGFLQYLGFVAMNPSRHLESHWDYYENLVKGDQDDTRSHREFYDEYNAVLDLSADFYLQTIKTVFQEHALPLGQWYVREERVDPSAIKGVSLLTIEGELDDISGSGQTQAAHALCSNIKSSQKKHLAIEKCGHYGIFSGRRWREIIYPQIRDFIAAQEKGQRSLI